MKFVLTLFAALFILSSSCAAYEVTFKYTCHTSKNDQFDQLVTQPLFAGITRATNGKVKFESYFNETLLKHNELWDGLKEGRAEVGLVISSFYYDRTPLSNVMDLPTLPHNASAAEHAGSMWRIYKKYPAMQSEYLSQGIRPLVFISTGPNYLFTSKPVAKLEDLRGIRLVTDSPITRKQFEFFDSADIYQEQLYEIFGLASQDACGLIAPAENYVLWKLGHITPYVTIAPLNTTYIVIAVSEKQWQALPAEIRKQVMDACGEKASRRFSAAYADHFAAIMFAESSDPTVITLTPEERQRWIDLNQPLVNEWLGIAEIYGLGETARKIYSDLQRTGNP